MPFRFRFRFRAIYYLSLLISFINLSVSIPFNFDFLFFIFCKLDVCVIELRVTMLIAASFPWNYLNHFCDGCEIT